MSNAGLYEAQNCPDHVGIRIAAGPLYGTVWGCLTNHSYGRSEERIGFFRTSGSKDFQEQAISRASPVGYVQIILEYDCDLAWTVAAAELLCAWLALGYVTTEAECAIGVSSEERDLYLIAGYQLSIHLQQLSPVKLRTVSSSETLGHLTVAWCRKGQIDHHLIKKCLVNRKTCCAFVEHTTGFVIFNPLKTESRLVYLKTQFVPRCKHVSSRL